MEPQALKRLEQEEKVKLFTAFSKIQKLWMGSEKDFANKKEQTADVCLGKALTRHYGSNSQLTQDILFLIQHPHCPFLYVNIGKTLCYMLWKMPRRRMEFIELLAFVVKQTLFSDEVILKYIWWKKMVDKF